MLELSKTLYERPYCHSNIPKVKCLIMLWLDNHVGETIEIKEQKNKVLPIIIQGNETARFGLSIQEKGPLVFEAFSFVNQKTQYLLNDKKSVDIPVQNTIDNLQHVVISYNQNGIISQAENDTKLEGKPDKVKLLYSKPTNTTQQISVTLFIENKLNSKVKLYDLISSMEPVKIDPYSKLQVTFKVDHGWPLKLKAETTENNKVLVNGQNMFPVNMKTSKENKYKIVLTIPSATVIQNNTISSNSQNTVLLNVNNTLAKPIVVMETINNLQPILIPPKTICKIGFLLNGADFLILTAIEIDKDHKGVKLNGHDNLAVQINMNPLDFNLINVTGDDVDVNDGPVNETNKFTGPNAEDNRAGNYGGIIQEGNKKIETLDKELEKEINKTNHIRPVENQEKDSVEMAEESSLERNKTDTEVSPSYENLGKEELKDITNISAIPTKALYPNENMTGSGNITKNSKTEVGVSGISVGSGMHYVRVDGNYSSGGNGTDKNLTEITSAPEKESESEGGGEVFTEPQIQNMNPEKAIPNTDEHDNKSLEKNLPELAHKGQSINLGDFTNADKAKQMVEAAHAPADAKNEHPIELNETKVQQKGPETPHTTTEITNEGAVSTDTDSNGTVTHEESVTLGNNNTTENLEKVGELGTSNSTEIYLNRTEVINDTETGTQQTTMTATNISEVNLTKIKSEPLNSEKVSELGTANSTEIHLNGTEANNTETTTQQTIMVATNISETNFTKIKNEPLNKQKLENVISNNTFEKNDATSNLTNTNNTKQISCFQQGNTTLNENCTIIAQVNTSKENAIAENLILENETIEHLNETSDLKIETSNNVTTVNGTKEPVELGNNTVIPEVNRTLSHSNFTKIDRNSSNTDTSTTNFGETLKTINNNLTTDNVGTVNVTQNITKNDGTANATKNITKSEKNKANLESPNITNSIVNESFEMLGDSVTKINPNISAIDGTIIKVESELETINKTISNKNTTKLPSSTSTNTNTSNIETDKNTTSKLEKDISSVNVTGLSSSDNVTNNTTDTPTLNVTQNTNATAANMTNGNGTNISNKLLPTSTELLETIDLGAQQTTAGFDSEEIVNAQELNQNEIQAFACKFLRGY